MTSDSLIMPEWPAPNSVTALSTTRLGGFSLPPYDSFNLGTHVGDDPARIEKNRAFLINNAELPTEPVWLNQVHGTNVINVNEWHENIEADAIFSSKPNQVCSIMTADCLPVLFTDKQGKQIAAAHAGWRGLLNGVLENTVRQFKGARSDILVWLGPAIGPKQFEVGEEVFHAFITQSPDAESAFKKRDTTHYLADIYQLAKQRLSALGIVNISGGQHCTVTEEDRFFSYRRDGVTGRMASLIWFSGK
ncbi:peptidoglycan editing factor PgeF [Methylophaga sp.]|uniref:peptidoglycan editing factor PgeF n=1 Tax=Methylophaga sp. TaxID=2024840 RepID=UPI003F695443